MLQSLCAQPSCFLVSILLEMHLTLEISDRVVAHHSSCSDTKYDLEKFKGALVR